MDQLTVASNLVSLESEKFLIGAMINEPELIGETALKNTDFYETLNQNLFALLKRMDEKQEPIGLIEVVTRVGSKLDKVGGVEYIANLMETGNNTMAFAFHEGIVIDKAKDRRTLETLQKAQEGILYGEDSGATRQNTVDELTVIDESDGVLKDGRIKDGLIALYEWAEQDHGEITGAASGYTELDKMTSGFQKQDFVIVGARPSVGKTAFSINVCLNYAKNNGPAAVFSLEMPELSLLKRMASNIGNIDAQRMRNPKQNFGGDDWAKFTMSMGQLGSMPFHIFDQPTVDMGYIRKHCRLMKRLYPGEHILVMIDYLQLIQGDPKFGGNRMAEISEISRKLKALARELDLTIIALSQLSRGVESRQDKRPMMSDLRESGQIEQDADVIMFLYREDYYDRETEARNIIEIIIAKQRNGPTGSVELAFVKEFNKFVNLERKFENG